MADEKNCFVISPIGDEGSDIRKRADQILKHIIAPAVEECGYTPQRADHIDKPGIITSQVIHRVVDDPLVIADLTGQNPNVFYELAIRHAIKKPLVQIIQKGEQIPFDVSATRTIFVDHTDLDSAEEAKKAIIEQIKSVEKDATDFDTPISLALDLQLFKQSENPEQRTLADILTILSEMNNRMLALELNRPSRPLFSGIKAKPNKNMKIDKDGNIVEDPGELTEMMPGMMPGTMPGMPPTINMDDRRKRHADEFKNKE